MSIESIMNKLVLLLALVGAVNVVDARLSPSEYILDVQELDKLLLHMATGGTYYLPVTRDNIYRIWCRPLLRNSVKVMDLLSGLFRGNNILQLMFRITEMSRLNLMTKFCASPELIDSATVSNRRINQLIPELIPWYKQTVNTYLVAEEMDYDLSTLICLIKKHLILMFEILPKDLVKAMAAYFQLMEKMHGYLVRGLFQYMNVDMHKEDCQIPQFKASNPLRLVSDKAALLFALDRATLAYNSGQK